MDVEQGGTDADGEEKEQEEEDPGEMISFRQVYHFDKLKLLMSYIQHFLCLVIVLMMSNRPLQTGLPL